jgi:hemerythrin superfamily protein
MDALTLLHEDHVAVAALFVEYVATQDKTERTTIVSQLRELLTAHSEIEETMVYPRLREQAADKEVVGVAFEEHHLMDLLLCQMADLEVGSEDLSVKLALLKKLVAKHVEEEESTLFDLARQVYGQDGLVRLGSQIEMAKAKRGKGARVLNVTMAPEATEPQTTGRDRPIQG